MTVEALSPLLPNPPSYRQVLMPNHLLGSFLGDDTDNHDFKFPARGKISVLISVDNAPDKALTITLYGMHEADGEVGDPGTFDPSLTNIVDAASKDDLSTNAYSYPFFFLRCAYAETPTDNPPKTVSVYVDSVVI